MSKNLKIVGFIPARGGSKGIGKKNLVIIGGYPLIARAILALKAAGIENVWVSTDDREIRQTSLRYGALFLNRPTELAQDDSPTEVAIEHFLKKMDCDIIIMVQCTSPMLAPKDIANGLSVFLMKGYDSLFSAVKTNDTLIWDKETLTPLNYDPKDRGRRQVRKKITLIESGGFYIFTKQMFMKTKCRLGGKIGYSLVPFWNSFQVDSKKDLLYIRKLMKK